MWYGTTKREGCNTVCAQGAVDNVTAIQFVRNSTQGLPNVRSKIQPKCSRAENGTHLNGGGTPQYYTQGRHSTAHRGQQSETRSTRCTRVRGDVIEDVAQ